MFVAFEIQIGLTSEIDKNKKEHVAYEESRILKSQTLLNSYIKASKDNKLVPSNAVGANKADIDTDKDYKIISAVLEGNFTQHNLKAWEDIELRGEGKTLRAPDRLCLNHKRLNTLANEGKAFILDEVSLKVSKSLQYCVKSMLLEMQQPIHGVYFGIFAHIGPDTYMVDVSSRYIDDTQWDEKKFQKDCGHYIIEPKVNLETLERISPLPSECDKVVLIAWGDPRSRHAFFDGSKELKWEEVRDEYYKGMKLGLVAIMKDLM